MFWTKKPIIWKGFNLYINKSHVVVVMSLTLPPSLRPHIAISFRPTYEPYFFKCLQFSLWIIVEIVWRISCAFLPHYLCCMASIIICRNKTLIISLFPSIWFCNKFNNVTKIWDAYCLVVRKKTIHSIIMGLIFLIPCLSLLHKYISTSKNGFFLF